MDEAEALVDFLVEDLELLLVHASSDPVHTDEVQIMTSLCRDLKFISSFLKNVPEYLLKQQKNEDQELGNLAKVVKSLKKEILGIFKDVKICAAIESPEAGVDACNSVDLSERSKGIAPFGQVGVAIGVDEGERALLERLIGGGEKQLEVISVSGITWNPGILVKRLFENPIILDHFQICEKGSFWFTETSCYSKLTHPYNRKAKGFFRKFCETARGNRYLVLMEKSEYKEVRTVLPDECNGSKVLMVEGFSDSEGKSGSLIVGEDLIVGIQDEAVALLDRLTGGKKQLEIISVAGMGGIEDCEISVRRLIQSWIAEGFIQCTEGKSLEHVAEDCLMNLIDRSLVTVSKKRPDGGVKTCCVHDMLRNLCIRKANENKFLLPNLRYESYSSSSPFRPLFINYFYSHNAFSLTCYKSNCEDLHSFYVHYVPARWVFSEQLLSFKYSPLRVLDLRCIIIDFFPTQILLLVRLKYLALWIEKMKSLPSAMCNLWNLETLILNIEKVRQVTIPHHVWKMVKLRHLHISPEIQFQWPCSSSAGAGAGASFVPFETLRNHIPELPASDTFSVSSQESILQTNSPKSHPSFAAYSSSLDQEFDHPYSGTATNSFFPHGNLLEQELEHPCSEAATTSSISDSLEPNSPELENGISCPSSSGPNVDHLYPSRKSSRLSELGKLHIIESAQPSFSVTSNSCQEELEEGLEEPSAYSSSAILDNLQTISRLCPSGCIDDVLERIPNVRKLGFHFTLSDTGDPLLFPDLADLHLLESLKFEYQTFGMVPMSLPHPDKFPPSLKKLTLVGSHVSWEEMTLIGMLPNLEVLKVKENFFSGPKWETCEGGFRNLKFLKFSHLDLREWITSADDFPSLEQLVLNGCLDLAEIPSAVGDICTLQVIEVYRASDSLIDSAMQIQETQRSWGNNEFKVFIHHDFQENISV